MNDWKPGDRFVVEYEIARVFVDGFVATTDGLTWDGGFMASAVKSPPKGRPARKGDLIRHEAWDTDAPPEVFVIVWDNKIITKGEHGIDIYPMSGGWLHEDPPSPILWEESE